MKIVKRMAGFVLMFVCLLSMVASAAVSKSSALKTARKLVPKGYTLVEAERDDDTGDWEFEFTGPNRKIEYEVNIRKKNGAVRRVEMEWKGCIPSGSMKISKARAGAIAGKRFKGVTITGARKLKDDGKWIWRVRFAGDGYNGLVKIDVNGTIREWEKRYE